ncbi:MULTISPECIES: hypothetical protein [Pseudoalteromonas]|uniref:Uncharacterized protein n=1 Tax=Pseudoalteromonas haloplanktis TaxID=228 RepID=A0ABU1BE07_PSEHA|nr:MULTISPECIES: hypothetical protein [Pseudoalteromonas]MCF6145773.1 hypothetical protein [Pseudoalteromonas mariniglutinosa NCIMB 1770]MDQ9092467.1 hypothetical protein [Pseudoalteromonas haloplanktis]TMN72148.1 hypothetical protein CWB85_08105 [Pseudoalteromonas sp. S1727]
MKLGGLGLGALLCVNVLTQAPAIAATQHQLDLGVTDLAGFDESFLGARYRYFAEDLEPLTGPYDLKADLNRVNNYAFGGFSNGDFSYLNTDAAVYGPEGLVMQGSLQRISDDNKDWQDTAYLVSAALGKQMNEQLQLGFNAYYSRVESNWRQEVKNVAVEWTYAPYVRWTDINKNQGWDLELKQLAGRYKYVRGKAVYYVNQAWSVGLIANIRNEKHLSDNYELQTHYWFNQHIALKFGLGSALDSESDLNSVSLLLTARL